MTTNVKTLSCIGNALLSEAGCPTSPKTFPTKGKAENQAYQAEGCIAWSIFIQPSHIDSPWLGFIPRRPS
ncbi:hypothetical protein, partial [Pseudomonas sp. DC418]|uniref:hypothetical protein n=1 Tax=Pseudomonas sp. DC418 TaxID=3418478 RepID=UPI003D290ADF